MKAKVSKGMEASVITESNGKLKIDINGTVYSESYLEKFGTNKQKELLKILRKKHSQKPSEKSGVKIATQQKAYKDMTRKEKIAYEKSFNEAFENSPTGEQQKKSFESHPVNAYYKECQQNNTVTGLPDVNLYISECNNEETLYSILRATGEKLYNLSR